MRKVTGIVVLRAALSVGLGGFCVPATAAVAQTTTTTTTATFDDLPSSTTYVPAGYMGLTWTLFRVDPATNLDITDDGGDPATVSAPNVAYMVCADPTPCTRSITSASPFNAVGGYFRLTDAGMGPEIPLTVTGTLRGTTVFTTTFDVWYLVRGTGTFGGYHALPGDTVDALIFTTSTAATGVVLDNFTFTQATTAPEPATLALLAPGLVGLVPPLRRRARRDRASRGDR